MSFLLIYEAVYNKKHNLSESLSNDSNSTEKTGHNSSWKCILRAHNLAMHGEMWALTVIVNELEKELCCNQKYLTMVREGDSPKNLLLSRLQWSNNNKNRIYQTTRQWGIDGCNIILWNSCVHSRANFFIQLVGAIACMS